MNYSVDSNGFSLGSRAGCPSSIAASFSRRARVRSSALQMSCLIVSFELVAWHRVRDDGRFTAAEVAVKCFDYRSPGLAVWMKF